MVQNKLYLSVSFTQSPPELETRRITNTGFFLREYTPRKVMCWIWKLARDQQDGKSLA